jgi:PAS domain S-box-containing protein
VGGGVSIGTGDPKSREPASRQILAVPSDLCAEARADAALFGKGSALVLVVGPDGLVRHASPGWTAVFGGSAAGRPLVEAVPPCRLAPAEASALARGLAEALAGAVDVEVPLAWADPEAGRRVLEGRLYGPLPSSENRVLVFHDVTQRAEEYAALIESERRFRTISQATRDMVTETSAAGRFTYVSPATEVVLGHSPDELVGTDPMRLHHPEDREAFLAAVRGADEPDVPFSVPPHRLRRRDGSWVWVEATGLRYQRADGELRVIGVARDITPRLEAAAARRELEVHARRTQKLESLGALTGGIAHDFNNLLTPILGAAGLVLAEMPEDSPFRKRVETILQASRRAAALTGQMLAYAGGTDLELRPVDVSGFVREMTLLLESTVSRRARIAFELEEGLPPVLADPGQLSQVIINLVVNASEALGESGRNLSVCTASIDVDRQRLDGCVLGEQREPGPYVTLEVRDDGEGIDSEVQEKVFDPFFSTKFTGRGLGLAMVVGIVRGHAGALQVESTPGVGTTFRVLLPVAQTGSDSSRIERTDSRAAIAPSTRSGVFLVVDDDEGVRDFVTVLLERNGFDVRSAQDGPEAIRMLEKHGPEVTGAVLDATMPGMSGETVLARIRELAPAVRILLVSGYSEERVAEAMDVGHTAFLRKPFEPEQLLEAIAKLFEETGRDRT